MAASLAQSVGMKSLVGVGGLQLGRSRNVQKSGIAKMTNDSSRAARAVSGSYCSSSGGLSQFGNAIVVPMVKSNGRRLVLAGSSGSSSSSSSGADEFDLGRALFSQSVEGVQPLETDQSSVGRNSGSAISSLPEDQDIAEPKEDYFFRIVESSSSADIARPHPIVQGFADSPFANEFAMDITGTAGAVMAGGGSEYDSMTVSLPMYQPKYFWFAKSAEQENIFIDKAINATIVGSAGVLAITKLLTVDHDYWHGWTLVEILKYAPVHNWFAYEELLKSHPILAKMMISGTVYSLGDWIAQCLEGKSALEFNRLRMFRSGLVGFCLHGSVSHFYYQFCEWLFPFQGWWVLPLKVGFDQTIWSAVWNSIYFMTVGLLRLESPARTFKEMRQTFFLMLSAGWKLWPFAHLVTYGLIPVEQRLLWVDMVEIIWVCILATYSNEKSEARIAEVESAEERKENILEGAVGSGSVENIASDGTKS